MRLLSASLAMWLWMAGIYRVRALFIQNSHFSIAQPLQQFSDSFFQGFSRWHLCVSYTFCLLTAFSSQEFTGWSAGCLSETPWNPWCAALLWQNTRRWQVVHDVRSFFLLVLFLSEHVQWSRNGLTNEVPVIMKRDGKENVSRLKMEAPGQQQAERLTDSGPT